MTKTVKFNAKDIFGKNFEIMDSFNNVKLVQNGLDKVYKAMDKADEEHTDKDGQINTSLLDYSNAIVPVILNETAVLLGLNKEDKEKLKGLSYSVIQDFYSQACEEFAGIPLPTVQSMQKQIERAQKIAAGQAEPEEGEDMVDPK